MRYIDKIFPFLDEAELLENKRETVKVGSIFIPIKFNGFTKIDRVRKQNRIFNAYRVMPCNILVLDEDSDVLFDIVTGAYGTDITLNVMTVDYMPVAQNIEIIDDNTDGSDKIPLKAFMQTIGNYVGKSFKQMGEMEEIITDSLINIASNNSEAMADDLKDIKYIEVDKSTVTLKDLLNKSDTEEISEGVIDESDKRGFIKSGIKKGLVAKTPEGNKTGDLIYDTINNYFTMNNEDSEKIPLLVGPTAVFKSATVKELCKKFDYRMVDFRVAFTTRLDYTGLYGTVKDQDNKALSYTCPMEELVTCSDGFREYCKEATDDIEEILENGYIENEEVSDGENKETTKEPLTMEQRDQLEKILEKYRYYLKTPVIFFDEITRNKIPGVNNVIMQMINEKKLDDMTMKGCLFVAATNLNLDTSLEDIGDISELYDVNTELDAAYIARFNVLKVYPDKVQDRWISWARGKTTKLGKEVTNIHPVVLSYLEKYTTMIYDYSPVIEKLLQDVDTNEIKVQSFPNYRTWDMVSDYLYHIDDAYDKKITTKREYDEKIVIGLISERVARGGKYAKDWSNSSVSTNVVQEPFLNWLDRNGYVNLKSSDAINKRVDDVGNFLSRSLDNGIPALLIGPSSLGKSSRVRAYMKKLENRTGVKPILISISLANKESSDLMGYPQARDLVDYVAGDLPSDLKGVAKKLRNTMNHVVNYGKYHVTKELTVRAPNKSIADQIKQAIDERRDVVILFDEVNRNPNKSVVSSVFEAVSDYRFGGVSFKEWKDHVHIVACCNMNYDDGKNEVEAYTATGSLDPAFAARFAIYWKKTYDKNDVASWIDFMKGEAEDGKIDPILYQWVEKKAKENIDDVIDMMKSVEQVTLTKAQPSTRSMYALSKDIQSMRTGNKANMFRGRVLFSNKIRTTRLGQLKAMSRNNLPFYVNELVKFAEELLMDSYNWEPLLTGRTVTNDFGNGQSEVFSAEDVIDTLKALVSDLKDMIGKDSSKLSTKDGREDCLNTCDGVTLMLDDISTLDTGIKNDRMGAFEVYIGSEYASDFNNTFSQKFCTERDMITIEQLTHKELIPRFMEQVGAELNNFNGDTDREEKYCIELIDKFLKVHSKNKEVKSEHYSTFIEYLLKLFSSTANMEEMLKKAGENEDEMFVRAEENGDDWIYSILYPIIAVNLDAIKDKRESMTANTKRTKKIKKYKSRIL